MTPAATGDCCEPVMTRYQGLNTIMLQKVLSSGPRSFTREAYQINKPAFPSHQEMTPGKPTEGLGEA